MDNKQLIKWIVITVPILIGGVVVYVEIKKLKKLPKQTTVKDKDKPAPPSDFPLKVGSKNNTVKILQAELGVSVDGIFGAKETLPALKEQTGKTEIKDQADLDATIAYIEAQDSSNAPTYARQDATDKIVNQVQATSNNLTTITFLQDIPLFRLNQNSNGDLVSDNGDVLNFKEGDTISIKDFYPMDDVYKGYLVLKCYNNINTTTPFMSGVASIFSFGTVSLSTQSTEGWWAVKPTSIKIS